MLLVGLDPFVSVSLSFLHMKAWKVLFRLVTFICFLWGWYICACVCGYVWISEDNLERLTLWFFMCILGITLRYSGLVPNAFTRRALSLHYVRVFFGNYLTRIYVKHTSSACLKTLDYLAYLWLLSEKLYLRWSPGNDWQG